MLHNKIIFAAPKLSASDLGNLLPTQSVDDDDDDDDERLSICKRTM